jgi:uncharacterized repeat protein (TIGR02543 family)
MARYDYKCTDCDIVFEDQIYTGSEVTPIPTVTLNGRELEYGTDFQVDRYEDNVEVGEARALVHARYTVVGGSTWRTFNIVPPTYTLIWLDAQGGELLTRTYAMGEDRPSFEGEAPGKTSDGQYTYAFAGWRLKEGSETGSATYEPTYDATPIPKGTLTFDLGGGTLDGRTGTITIEANVGDTISLPGAPTKDGYTFKCWKGSEHAAGVEYTVEGDHAFTAEWEKDAPAEPDEPDKPAEPAEPKIPPTGDASSALLGGLSLAAIASLCVLAGCAIRRREG